MSITSRDRFTNFQNYGSDQQRLADAISDLSGRREILDKIRACVLLGGLVRSTPLIEGIDRSVLDLPLRDGYSVLDQWRDEAIVLAGALGQERLPVRVVIDEKSILPHLPDNVESPVAMSVERDAKSFRGTGGVLQDLSAEYHEDDFLIVANAAQMLQKSLPRLIAELSSQMADVAIISHVDGTPSGLMLVRCGALRSIPSIGFIDMKEQALPRIAANHNVKVVEKPQAIGLPIRNTSDYVKALQGIASGNQEPNTTLHEDWRPAFGIIEAGAEVGPDAHIHDSVVLRGARVGKGALLVRSVVCPGARVARHDKVIDQLVTQSKSTRRGSQ